MALTGAQRDPLGGQYPEDSDFSDDVDGEEVEIGKSTAERQAELLHQISAGRFKHALDNDDSAEEFLKEYGDIVAGGESGTLIHVALEKFETSDLDHFKPLFRLLVRKYPAILERRNLQGETTLHYAIKKNRGRVLVFLCSSASPEAAANALACDGPDGGNCLHAILRHRIRPNATMKLISMCNSAQFLDQDSEGQTPLHRAVVFHRYQSEENEDIVDILLVRGQDAAYELDKEGRSPLRVHVESRRRFLRGQGRKESGMMADAKVSEPVQVVRRQPEKEDDDDDDNDDDAEGVLEVSKHLGALEETASRATTAPPRRRNTDKKSMSNEQVKDMVAASEKLQNMLKALFLRSRPISECQRLIYGQREAEAKELCLDIAGTTVTDAFLNNLSDPSLVRFESVLAYVRLSSSCFPSRPDKSKISHHRPKESLYPNSDTIINARSVFIWLRLLDQVRKVISVSVLDDFENPHSEEDIESLMAIDLEELDWQKRDICSQTLLKAAPNVQKLYLYWSGSNPVLRAWSEPEGLVQLQKLTSIILRVSQGGETRNRTTSNVRSFVERLHKSKWQLRPRDPEIDIIWHFEDEDDDRRTYTTYGGRIALRRGSWTDELMKLSMFVSALYSKKRLELPPIRVCLIDDGVDISKDNRHIAAGMSFSDAFDIQTKDVFGSPWYVSTTGHGADICQMLHKYAAGLIHLYIAKVDMVEGNLSHAGVNKALRWAADKGADIVCIGNGINPGERSLAMETEEMSTILARNCCTVVFPAASKQPDGPPEHSFIGGRGNLLSRAHDPAAWDFLAIRNGPDASGSRSGTNHQNNPVFLIPSTGPTSKTDSGRGNLDDASTSLALGCALAVIVRWIGRLSPPNIRQEIESHRLEDVRRAWLSISEQGGRGETGEFVDLSKLSRYVEDWEDKRDAPGAWERMILQLTMELFGKDLNG